MTGGNSALVSESQAWVRSWESMHVFCIRKTSWEISKGSCGCLKTQRILNLADMYNVFFIYADNEKVQFINLGMIKD